MPHGIARYMKPCLLLMALLVVAAPLAHAADDAPALKCDVGPVTRTYGGVPWLVYSCHDDKSLTFVTAPGNPASPSYFTLYVKDGIYKIEGQGTGDKHVTDATYAELSKLSTTEILQLIVQTKDVGSAPAPAPDAADAPLRQQLVGHWAYHDQFGDNELFFGADGSFSGTIKRQGKLAWTYGGTWSVEHGRIIYTYTLSNPHPEKVGMLDIDMVQDMQADCFTLISASTDVARVCRAP